jgi:hypothetical protein
VPLYFFHVVDGEFLVDATGTNCEGLTEVRHQAIKTAGEILTDKGGRFPSGLEWQMHVTDVTNKTVFKLKFSAEEPKI